MIDLSLDMNMAITMDQASDIAPTQPVEGSCYYNTKDFIMYAYINDKWVPLSLGSPDVDHLKRISRDRKLSKLLDENEHN